MAELHEPLELRSVKLRNRIGMAPMCMYSCPGRDGLPDDWHVLHYTTRAIGGCSLIITEATAVDPLGRISLYDTGLWNDDQVHSWRRVTDAIKAAGGVPCAQLAHAGRKAGSRPKWDPGAALTDEDFGGPAVSASPLPFNDKLRVPLELSELEITELTVAWGAAARRAHAAGFEAVELHMAHGYLLHQFLSPLTNQREDAYGGDLENRMRLPLMIAQFVRFEWPSHLPLLVRISATDWVKDGWSLDDSAEFARRLKEIGVDLVDCSSGGAVPEASVLPVAGGELEPGYQVEFARAVREGAGIPTAAVGLITGAEHAAGIVARGEADLVLLGRELLRNPYWPLTTLRQLGQAEPWPRQYEGAV